MVNRELKAPFVPPKSKLHNDKEITKAITVAKPITDEIKVISHLKNRMIQIQPQMFINQKRPEIQIGIKIIDH